MFFSTSFMISFGLSVVCTIALFPIYCGSSVENGKKHDRTLDSAKLTGIYEPAENLPRATDSNTASKQSSYIVNPANISRPSGVLFLYKIAFVRLPYVNQQGVASGIKDNDGDIISNNSTAEQNSKNRRSETSSSDINRNGKTPKMLRRFYQRPRHVYATDRPVFVLSLMIRKHKMNHKTNPNTKILRMRNVERGASFDSSRFAAKRMMVNARAGSKYGDLIASRKMSKKEGYDTNSTMLDHKMKTLLNIPKKLETNNSVTSSRERRSVRDTGQFSGGVIARKRNENSARQISGDPIYHDDQINQNGQAFYSDENQAGRDINNRYSHRTNGKQDKGDYLPRDREHILQGRGDYEYYLEAEVNKANHNTDSHHFLHDKSHDSQDTTGRSTPVRGHVEYTSQSTLENVINSNNRDAQYLHNHVPQFSSSVSPGTASKYSETKNSRVYDEYFNQYRYAGSPLHHDSGNGQDTNNRFHYSTSARSFENGHRGNYASRNNYENSFDTKDFGASGYDGESSIPSRNSYSSFSDHRSYPNVHNGLDKSLSNLKENRPTNQHQSNEYASKHEMKAFQNGDQPDRNHHANGDRGEEQGQGYHSRGRRHNDINFAARNINNYSHRQGDSNPDFYNSNNVYFQESSNPENDYHEKTQSATPNQKLYYAEGNPYVEGDQRNDRVFYNNVGGQPRNGMDFASPRDRTRYNSYPKRGDYIDPYSNIDGPEFDRYNQKSTNPYNEHNDGKQVTSGYQNRYESERDHRIDHDRRHKQGYFNDDDYSSFNENSYSHQLGKHYPYYLSNTDDPDVNSHPQKSSNQPRNDRNNERTRGNPTYKNFNNDGRTDFTTTTTTTTNNNNYQHRRKNNSHHVLFNGVSLPYGYRFSRLFQIPSPKIAMATESHHDEKKTMPGKPEMFTQGSQQGQAGNGFEHFKRPVHRNTAEPSRLGMDRYRPESLKSMSDDAIKLRNKGMFNQGISPTHRQMEDSYNTGGTSPSHYRSATGGKNTQPRRDPEFYQQSEKSRRFETSKYHLQRQGPRYHQERQGPRYHQERQGPRYHQERQGPRYHQEKQGPQYQQEGPGARYHQERQGHGYHQRVKRQAVYPSPQDYNIQSEHVTLTEHSKQNIGYPINSQKYQEVLMVVEPPTEPTSNQNIYHPERIVDTRTLRNPETIHQQTYLNQELNGFQMDKNAQDIQHDHGARPSYSVPVSSRGSPNQGVLTSPLTLGPRSIAFPSVSQHGQPVINQLPLIAIQRQNPLGQTQINALVYQPYQRGNSNYNEAVSNPYASREEGPEIAYTPYAKPHYKVPYSHNNRQPIQQEQIVYLQGGSPYNTQYTYQPSQAMERTPSNYNTYQPQPLQQIDTQGKNLYDNSPAHHYMRRNYQPSTGLNANYISYQSIQQQQQQQQEQQYYIPQNGETQGFQHAYQERTSPTRLRYEPYQRSSTYLNMPRSYDTAQGSRSTYDYRTYQASDRQKSHQNYRRDNLFPEQSAPQIETPKYPTHPDQITSTKNSLIKNYQRIICIAGAQGCTHQRKPHLDYQPKLYEPHYAAGSINYHPISHESRDASGEKSRNTHNSNTAPPVLSGASLYKNPTSPLDVSVRPANLHRPELIQTPRLSNHKKLMIYDKDPVIEIKQDSIGALQHRARHYQPRLIVRHLDVLPYQDILKTNDVTNTETF